MIYFENFSFISVIWGSRRLSLFFKANSIYYIDSTYFAKKLIIPIMLFFGFKVYQLNFKMLDIVDDNGELVRTRIHREDLFVFKNEIIKSEGYRSLFHKSWKQNSFIEFLNKGLTDFDSINPNSVSRGLLLINVVKWHMQKFEPKEVYLFLSKRPWFKLYQNYASKRNIEVFEDKLTELPINQIKSLVRRFPLIYRFFKNLKYRNLTINLKNANSLNRIYVDGRGDVNLSNDGMHSDFFWLQNSQFPASKIIYKYHSNIEKDLLLKNGIVSVSEGIYSFKKNQRDFIKPKVFYSRKYKTEYKLIKTLIDNYYLERLNYASLFKRFGAKVFITWDKYQNNHIAWSDAISDNGGVSAVWQMAFDGFKNVECLTRSDIVFSFSKFSCDIDKSIKSNIEYNIIVGYCKDYASSILKNEANLIRANLKKNGAKKIVFVIDENSVDDSRWHTGHELQRENYRYILEELITCSWLGVVFKPKRIANLRKRLGPDKKLLDIALNTGRCHIFEATGRYTTSAPPILAGLVADVCIHGHLDSGTAALECALEGLPTLLIDREGTPYSKLNQLPKGKVVFNDWPSAIEALMKHFNSSNGLHGFGDWSAIIDELDPFRDGMAAKRIGTYLEWIVEGYDKGETKEVVMKNAAIKYASRWGSDKVIIS